MTVSTPSVSGAQATDVKRRKNQLEDKNCIDVHQKADVNPEYSHFFSLSDDVCDAETI